MMKQKSICKAIVLAVCIFAAGTVASKPVYAAKNTTETEKQSKDLSKVVKKGKYYYAYNEKGKKYKVSTPTIVSIKNHYYCVYDKKGRVKTSSWFTIKGKLYRAKKNGRLVVDASYDGIAFNKNGAAKNSVSTRLKLKCMKIAKSRGYSLRSCFNYMAYGGFSYASKYPKLRSGWTRSTAYDMLMTKRGNCYSFACAFAALAKECGYSPRVYCGRIPGSRDGARDGMTRHCWVVINGKFYDPEGEFAGFAKGYFGAASNPFRHTVQSTWSI